MAAANTRPGYSWSGWAHAAPLLGLPGEQHALCREPVFDHPGGDLGTAVHAQLAHDALDVLVHRALLDHEGGRDLPVAQPAREEQRDLVLTLREERCLF